MRAGCRSLSLVAVLALAAVPGSADDQPRNLLLITIDTLRADYLSCNGSDKVQTPHLDRLASEGANFTRARSPVPLTLPAHASILTGNYPPTHSVRDNGAYRLPDEQLSMTEVLQQRGYTTAGFVASFVLDHRFGLDQGFDHYDDRVWSNVEELENLEAERNAEQVLGPFATWIDRLEPGPPFFAWVHLYDPHAPYQAPEPYRSRYPQDPYAAEVAYTDDVVGKILTALETTGHLASTLIAVVGDHGEGLGEHQETTHSLLIYNSTLHVPMLLWAPGLVPPKVEVDELVRIIDLAPTLLDYLGSGQELGQGVSLRPLIEGTKTTVPPIEETVAYSESLYPEINLGWSRLQSLETDKYKFIVAPTPELYDLKADPGETTNLLGAQPQELRDLRKQLAELTEELESAGASASAGELDEASLRKLRSLGYLSGSARSAGSAPAGSGADPKQMLEVWNRIQLAIFDFSQQDFAASAEQFEAVLQQDPQIRLAYEYLASCHLQLGQPDQAEQIYARALAEGLESSQIHLELGRIHRSKREVQQAVRELEIALALDELSVPAHYELATIYRDSGRPGPAVESYNSALAIDPDYVWAWNGLGITLSGLKKNQESLRAFRKVVELDPDGAEGHFNLAVQLERMGERDEALATYQRFMELSEGGSLEARRARANEAIKRLGG